MACFALLFRLGLALLLLLTLEVGRSLVLRHGYPSWWMARAPRTVSVRHTSSQSAIFSVKRPPVCQFFPGRAEQGRRPRNRPVSRTRPARGVIGPRGSP